MSSAFGVDGFCIGQQGSSLRRGIAHNTTGCDDKLALACDDPLGSLVI